jgi:hypothetical protein
MNIDNWIRDNFREDWIQINPVPFVTHRIGNEFDFGEFRYGERIERISEWQAIDTIGANNSCLIHSILTLSSQLYVRMNRLHKIIVAERFRVYIRDHIRFNASEINDLQRGRLLSDAVGEKMARYLGYNLVILKAQRDRHKNPIPNIIQTDDVDRRVLVIINKGGVVDRPDSGFHFEAVIRYNELIAQPEFTEAILPLIQELLERPYQNEPHKPNHKPHQPNHHPPKSKKHDMHPEIMPHSIPPDNPKVPVIYKNMIDCMKNKHSVIKHRAHELGLSDVGTKAKICNLILKRAEPSRTTTELPSVYAHTTHSKPLCSVKRSKKKSGELSLPRAKKLAQQNGLSTKGSKSDICKRLSQKHLVRLLGRRSKRRSRSR